MIRASVLLLTLAMAAPAAAESTVEFVSTGNYQNVRAVIVADAEGGFVDIQAGMILASINPDEQNLAVLQTIEADLAPNERRELTLSTFCLHDDRGEPRAGQVMTPVGRVDRDVLMVVLDARGRANPAHQQAVWGLRSGHEPYSPDGVAVLRRLGLAVKTR
jgi:hypothetical protein